MVVRILNYVLFALEGLLVLALLFLVSWPSDSLPKAFRGEGHGDAIFIAIVFILLFAWIHRIVNKRRNGQQAAEQRGVTNG